MSAVRERSSAVPRARAIIRHESLDRAPLDPIALFAAAVSRGADAVAWLCPGEGTALVAAGAALTLEARGPDRLRELRARWAELRAGSDAGAGLRAFVGCSFDERVPTEIGPDWRDLPAALLVVPELLWEFASGRTRVHAYGMDADRDPLDADLLRLLGGAPTAVWPRTAPAEGWPELEMAPAVRRREAEVRREFELPTAAQWRLEVAGVRDSLSSGTVEKVVLARAVRVRAARADTAAALRALARRYPDCTVFAVSRGDSCFLGATPEPLVSLRDGIARASCVAGTAARGSDVADDLERARALAASAKDRAEHEPVVRVVSAALEERCDGVVLRGPRLMALANVWHLAAEVEGRARADMELLDLAAALHPTPAVCGVPREAALGVLASREPFDRGWYAGALGWVDGAGEGELVVGLRSALLRDGSAWAFAGCGIVPASDPDAELAESELKLRPVLEALGAR